MNSKKAITLLVLVTLLMSMVPIMPVSAAITPTSGYKNVSGSTITTGDKGDTVVLTGGSVTAGALIELYWDAVAPWDGTDGLLNTTTAKPSGSYVIWFDVPESTIGDHYLWLRDVSTGDTVVNGGAFEVVELVKASASSGLEGDDVDVDVYGFPDEVDVAFLLIDDAGTPETTAATYVAVVQTAVTSIDFTLTHTLIVPGTVIMTDGVTSWVDSAVSGELVGTGDTTGTGIIDYLTGDVELTYGAAAVVGDLDVTSYDYYVNVQDAVYVFSSGEETSELGSVTDTATIPLEASVMAKGTYNLLAMDGAGNSATKAFAIGAVISIDVEEGPVGTILEISGRGFEPAEKIVQAEIQITKSAGADGVDVPILDPTALGEVIDSLGEFTFEIVIPSVDMDLYNTITVTETGAAPDDVASVDFEILGEAEIEVTPGHGTQGSSVLVEGWNFTAGEDVTLSMEGIGDEDFEVDADGSFAVTYTVPAVGSGPATLLADQDALDIDAETEFRAGIMIVILNPTEGPAGTKVTLTGTGFTEAGSGIYWNATFGDEDWQTDKLTVSTEISAEALYVPTTEPGVYTVTILDVESEIEVEVLFTVTGTTSLASDPVVAPAGYELTIEGYNFYETVHSDTIGTAITEFVMYNDTVEWEGADLVTYEWGVTDADDIDDLADGYFEIDIKLPVSDDISVGSYTLNVTDKEGMTAQYAVEVVAKTVDINSRKAEFNVGDTLAFNVESSFTMDDSYIEISDPSGDLYWSTDIFADTLWLKVGDIQRVLYANQVSGGNPMVFLEDAPLGTWTWEYYDPTDDDAIDTGAFSVVVTAEDLVSGQVEALAANIVDLVDDIAAVSDLVSDVTGEFDGVRSDIAAVADLAAAAADAATKAAEAVSSVATVAGDAADAAKDAADAANLAKDAADGLTTLVYGAIGASLVAALAAIVSLMQISRRIAG